MKIIESNGKKTIKISKNEWSSIGKKSGWIKEAQDLPLDEREKYAIQFYNKINNSAIPETRLNFTQLGGIEGIVKKLSVNIKKVINSEELKSFLISFPTMSIPNLQELLNKMFSSVNGGKTTSQPQGVAQKKAPVAPVAPTTPIQR